MTTAAKPKAGLKIPSRHRPRSGYLTAIAAFILRMIHDLARHATFEEV
jgi:hypothetical protein